LISLQRKPQRFNGFTKINRYKITLFPRRFSAPGCRPKPRRRALAKAKGCAKQVFAENRTNPVFSAKIASVRETTSHPTTFA